MRPSCQPPNCFQMMASRELFDSSVGLVPTNALVVIHFWIVGYPGNCTTTPNARHGCGLYLQPAQYGCGLYLEPAQ